MGVEVSFRLLALSQRSRSGARFPLTVVHGRDIFLTTVDWGRNDESANRPHSPCRASQGQKPMAFLEVEPVYWEPMWAPLGHPFLFFQSKTTHCSDHPPSVPGGRYSVAEQRVGACSPSSLRSVSVPVLGFLLWPPTVGLYVETVPCDPDPP